MKNIKFILCLILLSGLYILFLYQYTSKENNGESPLITIEKEVLTISVKDNESILLNGVIATDFEDGNLTSKIAIDNISHFNENKERTVTYVVFDSDDNMTKATRKIKYIDYESPIIDLDKPLVFYYVGNNDEFKNFVGATSKLDGDLTSKLVIDKRYCITNQCFIDVSVVDSTGTKTERTLKIDELNTIPTITFELTDYLIYVPVNTTINPWNYIKKIELMGMDITYQTKNIDIQNNYDSSKPGMYEYIYRFSSSGGDYGIAKLVVIVE